MFENLTIQELSSLVEQYPWFPQARKELCNRLFEGGDEQWKKNLFATHGVYMPDRSVLYKIYCSKKNITKPVKIYKTDPRVSKGGDFFSQEDYASVSQGDYTFKIGNTKPSNDVLDSDVKVEFFTETLAEIYAEQGYIAQAKQIYNQLLLANPEKSAYFASLIENLNENIQ
ncbi:MAG: tetratricopeptide repeat protein [Bacteroidales bacterium]|nr:tetratricopeptide repeat protein [Bacteroidales bacterium]